MESQYGPQNLRKQYTYDELLNYIRADPDFIKLPNRKALQTYNHPFYGALLDNLRNDEDARLNNEQAYLDYRKNNNLGPYDPGPGGSLVYSPTSSEFGDALGLIDVVEDPEIPRPTTLPDPAGGDSLAQGLLREGLALPQNMLQIAGRAAGSVARGAIVGASEAAGAASTIGSVAASAAGTIGNIAAAGASEATGLAVDAGVAAMNSQMAQQIGNKFGRLGRLAFNRIANARPEAIEPVAPGNPHDQAGPIGMIADSITTGMSLSGILYGLGAGTPAGAAIGGTAALVGGARLIGGQIMRNRNRPLDHEDMVRDAAIHVFDRRQPPPLRPLREINGMSDSGPRAIDRRPAPRALPPPAIQTRAEEFYIGQSPEGEPDTPPITTNFDPLVLPSSRISMQMDPTAGPPLPQEPPASYRDLARQGRASLTEGSSSSSSQLRARGNNHRPAGRDRNRPRG